MARIVVPAAEEMLDRYFKVHNLGFVRLVDYMGSDGRIVQAARVSYGEGTTTRRKDKGLINYLLQNRHTSPFEQVILTFHCKMPIFVARQWVRHRTARLNEISGRYSVMGDEFYVPTLPDINFQSSDNKQGRSDAEVSPEMRASVLRDLITEQQAAYEAYQGRLDGKIARELSRINLPLSLYTQWYWQIDLHNLMHFLSLRLDTHAQLEIRLYGEVMAEMAKAVCPIAYEAFEEHKLHSVTFSRTEMAAIRAMVLGREVVGTAKQCGVKEASMERFLDKLKSPDTGDVVPLRLVEFQPEVKEEVG